MTIDGNTPLSTLQHKYCLADLEGQIRIVDRNHIQEVLSGLNSRPIGFYDLKNGKLLLERELEKLPMPSEPGKVIKQFLVSPNTHKYDSVAFSPFNLPATTINYWVDPTITATPGEWGELKCFLFEVICAGSSEHFDYLMKYLAHMLQRPEEKPGIMIVLLAGQGVGKGTFFTLLGRIWGRTTLQVSDIKEAVGQFNASLERNYVICLDEALFKGDRSAQDRLKSLITEPKCRIEQKYQPSRTIDSYHRFFAASNHEQFAVTDVDDRRFWYLRVAEDYKGNHTYFKKIHALINDDAVLGAMVAELQAIDLKDFNVRLPPKTIENQRQKIMSLSGFARYWYEVVQSGRFPHSYSGAEVEWDGSTFVTTSFLLESYANYDRNSNRHEPVQSNKVIEQLNKLCPSAQQSRQTVGLNQKRGLQLPCREKASLEFNKAMGIEITPPPAPRAKPDFRAIKQGQPRRESEYETYCIENEPTVASIASQLPGGWQAVDH